MNIAPLLRSLGTPADLRVISNPELARYVNRAARQLAFRHPKWRYRKPATAVAVPPVVTVSPFQVLHRLGVATTFLPGASPFARTAQHWAHVRYCGTLETRGRYLALTANAAEAVVSHHKVTQSEQLGIGLAIIVAQQILQTEHPGWRFDAVDADVALDAGYLDGRRRAVRQRTGSKKRPDYFLLGRQASGRKAFKAVVLECKGTHQKPDHSIKQLADACMQVNTVSIGGRPRRGLMVASALTGPRITSYALDPEAEEDLWSGSDQELAALLDGTPELLNLSPQPPTREQVDAQDRALLERLQADQLWDEYPETDEFPPPLPHIYDLPDTRRAWLTSVLARTTAASVAAYAGNTAAAAAYAPTRSSSLTDDEIEMGATASTLHLPGGLILEGLRFRAPVGGGRAVEFFRGLETSLYRDLDEGRVSAYFSRMDTTYDPHVAQADTYGDAVSLSPDGTALIMRLTED